MAMLCDPELNLETLRVGFIEGIYNETVGNIELDPTRFGRVFQETRIGKFIRFGAQKHPVPFNDTIPLREIYESEGNFTVTNLIIEFEYNDKIVYDGVPTEYRRILLHHFKKWNFSPTFLAKIFDRVPSHPLYKKIKKGRNKFLQRSGDKEAFKRLRSTWLVNKPVEKGIPYNVYTMWYGRGALIIPEKSADFKGRELGLDFSP